MRKNFPVYVHDSVKDYFDAIGNLFIFFPYFFSINAIFKTLLFPWKNLIVKKTIPGFSFEDIFNRIFFNTISRVIGLCMRLSIFMFYLIMQLGFFIFIPFITIMYVLTTPLFYLIYLSKKPDDEKKKRIHDQFVSTHLLYEKNKPIVEQWFESDYQKHIRKTKWWKLSNLFSYPPLARDWAVGYTPTLDRYVTDLTESTYQSMREHIVNRTKEINHIEQILTKSEEANVIIVGDEGVGKHTIIDALAKKLYEGRTNSTLMYKRILKLHMEQILSEYSDPVRRQHFFETLLNEASDAKNCILVIEDIERFTDLAPVLYHVGQFSLIQFIGISTPFAFQKYILHNDKLNRLFTEVNVYEINTHEAETVLLDNIYRYEKKHKLHIPFETIHELVEKSDYYISSIPFPEKAFHLLEEICIYAKEQKNTMIKPQYVDEVITRETHVPVIISDEMRKRLVGLEELLRKDIVQQEEAIVKLSSALRRSFVLLGKRKKPLASFLFLGPTGVGKTQTAKILAHIFFGLSNGHDNHLLRFDMSLYQSKTDIEKLLGSIDTQNPGLMASILREQPYGVLLLDEIEKAHPDLLNIFLTMLDEGYLTDGFGKRIDCRNCMIIATSNAGSDKIFLGDDTKLIEYLVSNHLFSPEFLNRFDGIIQYESLSKESMVELAKRYVDNIILDMKKFHHITLCVSDTTIFNIIDNGYDKKFGARNMERLIKNNIEDAVAKIILENKSKEGDIIRL